MDPELSLFLLTSVAIFYYARQGRCWLAGSWGFLAALTRLHSLLVVIPLAYKLWRQGSLRNRRPAYKALSVVLLQVGLAAFTLYLQWSVGDAL